MATYYISPTGNDSTGDGSSGNPWKTLAHAITNSIANDTIHFQAGTHTMATTNITDRILDGAGWEDVIVDAALSAPEWRLIGQITIQNISIRNHRETAFTNYCLYNNNQTGDYIFNDVAFIDCETHSGLGFSGILSIQNNLAVTATFNRCRFRLKKYSGASGGIVFSYRSQTVSTPIVCNNCVFHFSGTGSERNTGMTANFSSSGAVLTLKNCAIRMDDATGMAYNGTTTNNFDYCSYYQITSVPSGTGNLNADPLWIDAANLNYGLRPSSTLIDAGTLI